MLHHHLYNEKDLFRRVAEGDESAFATIFDHYFRHLYSLMLKYTNRQADAEDIVQQVFVTVWEKRHRLSEIENPTGWLFTLVRNEFLTRFRKLRKSHQYRQYLSEVFAEEPFSPEDIMIDKQRIGLLHQAIAHLSPQQKRAYLLSREGGLTYDEIAHEMGLGRTTVKEHISRALKTIKTVVTSQYNLLMIIGALSSGTLGSGLLWLFCLFF